MSVVLKIAELLVLLLDLLMQGVDFGKRTVTGARYCQGHAGTEAGKRQHNSGADTQDTPAKTLVGEVQCSGHLPCT
jgi:hypothetical protein